MNLKVNEKNYQLSQKQMGPPRPPAGRRVNLWQVSLLVHLRSVSVTLLTVPEGLAEDTLHRTAVPRLLMKAEEPDTHPDRHKMAGKTPLGRADHFPAGCRLK